jgi:protein TonB
MQGSVVIDAVIDEHGDVIEMKVLSGPPLLIQAALDAVRRWKYQPTFLNEEPVPVQLNVTVTFRLSD